MITVMCARANDRTKIFSEPPNRTEPDFFNQTEPGKHQKSLFCSKVLVIDFLSFQPKFPTASSCFFTRSGMNFIAQEKHFTPHFSTKNTCHAHSRPLPPKNQEMNFTEEINLPVNEFPYYIKQVKFKKISGNEFHLRNEYTGKFISWK